MAHVVVANFFKAHFVVAHFVGSVVLPTRCIKAAVHAIMVLLLPQTFVFVDSTDRPFAKYPTS